MLMRRLLFHSRRTTMIDDLSEKERRQLQRAAAPARPAVIDMLSMMRTLVSPGADAAPRCASRYQRGESFSPLHYRSCVDDCPDMAAADRYITRTGCARASWAFNVILSLMPFPHRDTECAARHA